MTRHDWRLYGWGLLGAPVGVCVASVALGYYRLATVLALLTAMAAVMVLVLVRRMPP